MLAEYLLDLLESRVYLSFGVGGHEAETDQSVVRGNGGRHHWVDKYTLFKQVAGHCEGLEVVADEQGMIGVEVWPISQPMVRNPSRALWVSFQSCS